MFQVILSSNSSLNNYPSNNGGCFHADLNETLHFNKFSWEVALSELFIIPNSWNLIREPFTSFSFRIHKLKVQQLSYESYLFESWAHIRAAFTFKTSPDGIVVYSGFHGQKEYSYRKFKNVWVFDKRLKSRNNWDTFNHPRDTIDISFYYVVDTFMYEDKYPAEFVGKIAPGNYLAPQLLGIIIKQCNDFLQTVIGNMKSKNIVLINDINFIDKANSESILSSVKHSDGKLEIKINETFTSKFNCQFKLPGQLNFILGFSEYLYQPEMWCSACKGVVVPDIYANTLINLYVFCDFIQPMFFNDKQIPLLRQVDCSESSGQIQHETFSNLLFKDISKTSIKTIKIWFSEYACGYPIFEMRSPSTVILVFRSI